MTNPRNYRTPTADDDADVPYWVDALAQDVAKDVAGVEASVSALEPRLPIAQGNEEVRFTITDADGRRSWLEMAPDGGPTEHAAAMIRDTLPPLPGPLAEESGWVFAITDTAGNIAAGVRASGKWEVPGAAGTAAPAAAPPVVGWGTSLMHGTTGAGTTLLTAIADTLGISRSRLVNKGQSGMRSPGVAARHGGQPVILTVPGQQIPASGSVPVSAGGLTVDVFTSWGGTQIPGTLAGVPGTLAYPGTLSASGPASFTRTDTGPAVVVKGPRPFLPDAAGLYQDSPLLLWIGRNNMNTPDRIVSDYRAIIDLAGHRRILVISELDGLNFTALNDRLAAEFPHYFIDLHRWLVDNGLAAVGISPTATDLADIAADRVPTSLMNDPTHPNAAGYLAAGRYLAPILRSKGWL